MSIEIIYADRDIAVCIKPIGVLSENEGMPALLANQLNKKEVFCVHRLDMAVSGIMVYALSKKAAAGLSTDIAQRDMQKEYLAIVQGKPEADSGVLKDLLYRDKAKNKSYVVKRKRAGVKDASLEYKCLEVDGDRSLVHITLHTGRSHQIRVQFSSRAMPLLGDVKYGSSRKDCDIALWSHSLSFEHPISGKQMNFTAPMPSGSPWNEYERKEQDGNI